MPQKRRSNAANSKRGSAGKVAKSGSVTMQNDIVGVLLAVVAIAMLVSLMMPSGAVVTHAVQQGLTFCFGAGAFLVPATLLLFAATFFVEGEGIMGGHVALGLSVITVSVLALISLFVPGADMDPSLVLNPEVVPYAGGCVGGGVAWLLLNLVGRPVGLVLLCGFAILGVIVCGFSLSDLFVRLRSGAERMQAVRAEAREERQTRLNERSLREDEVRAMRANGPRSTDGDKTTFIGARTTSVLTRKKPRRVKAFDGELSGRDGLIAEEEMQPSEKTDEARQSSKPAKTLKRRKPSRKRDRVGEEASPKDSGNVVVPDFLKQPKEGQASRGATKRAATSSKTERMARNATAPATTKLKHAESAKQGSRPGDGTEGYELPPMNMLSSNPNSAGTASSREELEETMERLQGTLREFGLNSRVVDYISGPIVTTFRVEMGEGERVSRIRNLEDDIALTLAAEKVRIFAPIPGTSFVGIEIPNKVRQNVHLGDVLPHASGGPLEVAIGRDSSGKPVVADIAKMPHMLVAGTTGSGKSVMINSMIMSLLMRTTPKQVRLIMIDPKRVEFSCYNGLPHLYVPVVTEPRQAASALQWAVSEMERRLKVFERAGAREIKVYNKMCVSGKLSESENPPEPLPYLVVIIDELSDLMMVAGKDVEASIVRIAQLARAAGIHLVIATQRPSANVVTGLIKSNIDNRVALKVSSGIDSRVILDETGAERLLGNGDMLFKYRGLNMQRVLGCYTSDNEINTVVEFIRDQAEPDYHEEILSAVVPGKGPSGSGGTADDEDDPLVWEAAQIVVESKLGSTSGLQRRLKVGYARAGRIMDMLEAKGVVGPPDGSKPREVLLDEDGLEELREQDARYREVV